MVEVESNVVPDVARHAAAGPCYDRARADGSSRAGGVLGGARGRSGRKLGSVDESRVDREKFHPGWFPVTCRWRWNQQRTVRRLVGCGHVRADLTAASVAVQQSQLRVDPVRILIPDTSVQPTVGAGWPRSRRPPICEFRSCGSGA